MKRSICVTIKTSRWILKPRNALTCYSWSGERSLSSWTRNDITTPDGKKVNLEIQQQFMAPPGGATTDSTGRHIWPTAKPLLQYMLSIHQEVATGNARPNKTVLELGSGCGLLGMGLALATTPAIRAPHSYQVVMTDHSTEWLQQNLAQNREALMRHIDSGTGQPQHPSNVEIQKLQWGNQQEMKSILETSRILNQKENADGTYKSKHFDYIVGSDVLYNPASRDALIATLKFFSSCSLLSKAGVPIILLAYPKRQSDEERFVLLAERNGFSVQTEPLQVPENDHDSTTTRKEYRLATLAYLGP